ncbi:hypothetical protein CHUV2995_02214 [Corynebacterium diphtheriae subsp. lausannense]|nr:hypothetical protein CHUV2995_02214 [Corynebacterium diphtheriae subsp. lausannense]
MFKKAFVAVLSVVALTVAGCGSPRGYLASSKRAAANSHGHQWP